VTLSTPFSLLLSLPSAFSALSITNSTFFRSIIHPITCHPQQSLQSFYVPTMNVDRCPMSSYNGALLLSRAIVSLNNSGLSLLERARYAEGKETLRDALALAALLDQGPQQVSPQTVSQIHTALRRAEQHLARPNGDREERAANVLLTILSSENAQAMESAALDFCASQSMFGVRLDDTDDIHDEDYPQQNYFSEQNSFRLAALLLNFGVACQIPCAASTDSNAATSAFYARVQDHHRHEQAFDVCRMAHELLSRQQKNSKQHPHHLQHSSNDLVSETLVRALLPRTEWHHHRRHHHQRSVILLHMLVCQTLMHLASELRRKAAGYKYYDRLCRLRGELPLCSLGGSGDNTTKDDDDDDNKAEDEDVDADALWQRRTAPAA